MQSNEARQHQGGMLGVLQSKDETRAFCGKIGGAGIGVDALAGRLADEGAKSLVKSLKDPILGLTSKSGAFAKVGS
jgi:hypothetical protein